MSQEDIDALNNASAIIDRFGGIRPMAAKVGAPVTTVQGWKKRDVIPGSRRADILKAANENNIDLGDILSGSFAPASFEEEVVDRNVEEKPASVFTSRMQPVTVDEDDDEEQHDDDEDSEKVTSAGEAKITVEPIRKPDVKPFPASFSTPADRTHEDLMAAIAKGQKKAVRAGVWTSIAFALLLGGAAAVLLWPSAQKIEQHEAELAEIQGKLGSIDEDVQAMNESAGFLKSMVPAEMQQKMTELQTQADTIRKDVQNVAAQAETISKTVLAADAGSLSDRLSVLETKLADVEGGQALKDLTARVRGLEASIAGQQQLADSVQELTRIVDSLDGQVNELDNELATAQKTPDSKLGQTLEGVSKEDMKAAALLIAFAQLRDSLNRNVPFEDDIVLLQKLAGDDNPELKAALERLAPQAEKGGVLTSEGLSEEFKGFAGDIVFASLKGEDVSPTEKAKARIVQALNLKKDGALIGGTPTQKKVTEAQAQLDKGDVQGAIATLNSLDPEAKAKAAPFIEQAEASVLADQIQTMLRQMIVANTGANFNAGGGVGAGAAGAVMGGSGTSLKDVTDAVQKVLPQENVVKDEESGFSVLPAPKGFKGFSSGTGE
jgi:hypothetical protein